MHPALLRPIRAAVFSLLAVLAATPAFAHHVMGGRTPATFMEGLLSGLAHPVIGPDHLAFLIAVGIIVGAAGLRLALPALYVITMAIGVATHVSGLSIPASEFIVGLSVLVAGGLIVLGRPLPLLAWAGLFAVAGFFHGYAFGESIFGAERTPIAAYLIGLVIVQTALVIAAAIIARAAGARTDAYGARIAGVAIVALGLATFMGLIPGA
jgi:urease accessory protein